MEVSGEVGDPPAASGFDGIDIEELGEPFSEDASDDERCGSVLRELQRRRFQDQNGNVVSRVTSTDMQARKREIVERVISGPNAGRVVRRSSSAGGGNTTQQQYSGRSEEHRTYGDRINTTTARLSPSAASPGPRGCARQRSLIVGVAFEC